MAQNIFIFPEEDVIVSVPKMYRGNEIFVETKGLTKRFKRTVINLWVYYDNDGVEAEIPRFDPHIEIWVGRQAEDGDRDLYYWDDTTNQRVPLSEDKVEHSHKDAAKKQDYIGYGYVVRTEWPADPNVGWD